MKKLCVLFLVGASWAAESKWVSLANGKNLDGWEVVGDGFWSMLSDGTIAGQRNLAKVDHQSWLYTRQEFGEFELQLDFWTRLGGNSGVSILDTSRARYSCGKDYDSQKTPSHIGYEIQISFGYPDEYPTGSVYNFVPAKRGVQKDNDWNRLNIEHRNGMVRVKLNGQLVVEHARDADRAKAGPIGLQLHDRNSVLLVRNIKVREYPAK